MSVPVGRDAPGTPDETVGARLATRRAGRIDTLHCPLVYCQYEIHCKGTVWRNRRGRSLADFGHASLCE